MNDQADLPGPLQRQQTTEQQHAAAVRSSDGFGDVPFSQGPGQPLLKVADAPPRCPVLNPAVKVSPACR
jgi:hypothetical protein